MPVIDTDIIARKLVRPDQPGLEQIVACFGKQILDVGGILDRAQLRAIIFGDAAEQRKLEQILHPLIHTEMQRQLGHIDTPCCIVEIPLLLETGWHDEVSRVLVVDAPQSLQIERSVQRGGIDKQQVEQIIATQMARSQRLAAADDVITNKGSLPLLKKQVEQLHRFYMELSGC